MDITLRLEQPQDHRAVEMLTREAFWNLHVPGCDEHFVAHQLRRSPDFLPELDFVALFEGELVGNIMYTRSAIQCDDGSTIPTLTFGPVSVLPAYQHRGIGSTLIRHTLALATAQGHPAVIIFGNPAYYQRFGFVAAKAFGIRTAQGVYPAAHLALALTPEALSAARGIFCESAAFEVEADAFARYEQGFPEKQKLITPSQAHFERLSTLLLDD